MAWQLDFFDTVLATRVLAVSTRQIGRMLVSWHNMTIMTRLRLFVEMFLDFADFAVPF